MSIFYFAWVDEEDNVFGPSHHVEDEFIIEAKREEVENSWCVLNLLILNPMIGLLSPSRKQWAWFSGDSGNGTVRPLFFGRVFGVPSRMSGALVEIILIGRSSDFETRKAAAADAERVLPGYDPAFIAPERREDPDSVMDNRAAFWHIDRLTHEVTISDAITPSAGVVDLGTTCREGSVEFSHDGRSPASVCEVEATVSWDQVATGTIDVRELLRAAAYATGTTVGDISTFSPGLSSSWPEDGKKIGKNWTVDNPKLVRIDGEFVERESVDVTASTGESYGFIRHDYTIESFRIAYDVSRRREEILTFRMVADIQPLLAEPGEDSIVTLTPSSTDIAEPIDADGLAPIRDSRRRQYFATGRGRKSIDYLISLAAANLLLRARAAEVEGEIGFWEGEALTLNHGLRVEDERIPGGEATGKISQITLYINGDTGQSGCQFTIAPMCGRGGEVVVAPGEPVWVEEEWVEPGWQQYVGAVHVPVPGIVGYEDFSIPPDDDGIDFFNFTAEDAVYSIDLTNGVTEQESAIISLGGSSVSKISLGVNPAEICLKLIKFGEGPYLLEYPLVLTAMVIPKTIDLETEVL